MKKILIGCICILSIIILTLSACSQSPSATSPSTSNPPQVTQASETPVFPTAPSTPTATNPVSQIKRGGLLKIIYTGGSVTNIGNPGLLVTPSDSIYNSPAVEMLIAPDDKGNLNPLLATSWDINSNQTPPNIVFHLRKGVKFHDGTDFNAEAVKFNLDLARTGERSTNLSSITSVEVIDDYTVRVNLTAFDYTILTNLASSSVGWIVSPTAIQTHDKEWTTTHPVGTGPFRFVSYNRDVSVKYERFDGYWQAGKPYLDGVEFEIVADQMTGLLAFKSGEGQVLPVVQAKDADSLKQEGFTVIIAPASVVDLVPSSADPKSPLSDLRVRRAIDYAIDKKAIASSLGYGYYEPANQPFVSSVWAYNPEVVGYPYNPAKAKELLKEAGYPNGFKIPIWMVQGSSQ
ncbi:MAG: ABC transporter substrate-binding protein, partial [Dehalococcoidales bacterium]|nr:ABC transporter substrate-binding protein [Dehalococcoidales bacterium]